MNNSTIQLATELLDRLIKFSVNGLGVAVQLNNESFSDLSTYTINSVTYNATEEGLVFYLDKRELSLYDIKFVTFTNDPEDERLIQVDIVSQSTSGSYIVSFFDIDSL